MRIARAAATAAVLAGLSCGERPAGEALQPNSDLIGTADNAALVACDPLPGDSTAVIVGPEGGILLIGPHRLHVPPGAVDGPVRITAALPPEPINRIRFGPSGLVFRKPAELTMSHANCGVLAGLLSKRIAWVGATESGGALAILEYLPSTDDLVNRRVSAPVDHFSSYAIAW